MNKLKLISLKKGMKKEEVNNLVGKWIIFEDETYEGNNYKHNWKCKCGESIKGRQWSNIRNRGSIQCEICKYEIKDSYNDIKKVHLKKGMKKEEVNNLVDKWIILEDHIYKGNSYKHNWKCKCGNNINARAWNVIKNQYAYKCKSCINKDKIRSIKFEDLQNDYEAKTIKDIKLECYMTKEFVNKLIKRWLELDDDLFLGCEHPHNWRCKCGELIEGRRWSNIKTRESIKCEKCKYGIKESYNDLKEVHLKIGMKKEEVNNLIGKWIIFEDEIYKGSKYKHSWKCKCGRSIQVKRSWSDIKSKNLIKCKDCIIKILTDNHKRKVESIKGYTYICSYFKGDKLKDTGKEVRGSNTHIRVRHEYCKSEYDITASEFINDGHRCSKCCGSEKKSVKYQYPKIAEMIDSDENDKEVDTLLISPHTKDRFYFICPQCNKKSKKTKSLTTVVSFGFSCDYCSDGISIPEKLMTNILEQLNAHFKTQLSKKDVLWIKDKRKYDIVIFMPYGIVIIELHGLDHYKENKRGKSLAEIKANDRYKKHLAKKNNVKKYYQIDCRYSDKEYLKKHMYRPLVYLFGKEALDNVNWETAWCESQRSIRVKVWDLYKNKKDKEYICKTLNRSISAVNADIREGKKHGIIT